MGLTPDKLREIGEALYGPHWQGPFAKALGLASDRTLQRWAAGHAVPPDGVVKDLAKLCRERGAALTALADELTGKGLQSELGEDGRGDGA